MLGYSVGKLRLVLAFFLMGWLVGSALAAESRIVGPEGGDVRRLVAVPDNPNRIFLGTSSGRLYVSDDGGHTWSRFAHLGEGFDYVLDNIEIDPTNSKIMYVGAWSADDNQSGAMFRSNDGGFTWAELEGMKGKSVRALKIAPSDHKVLVAGAVDGVYRSNDGGKSWQLISASNRTQIKEIESIAVDPGNPDTIYAGTWHLAWKTTDGGQTWHRIDRGMIDDSDVFSIIIDPEKPNVVYASACSGIYQSQTAGELFRKIPGIPFSARRTRVLKQDPNHPEVVYAGTTEGLWRTADAGKTWKRISSTNLIVNDVLVDPKNSDHVLLATDRIGVLMSANGAKTFEPSNHGFTSRQVSTVVVDSRNPNRLYAGTVNDHEYGGVFISEDGGTQWKQMSNGLGGHDVLQIAQNEKGLLFAATDGGLFHLSPKGDMWMKTFPVRLDEKVRINQISFDGNKGFAATSQGLYVSNNNGLTWTPAAGAVKQSFLAVRSSDKVTAAATGSSVYVTYNDGQSWSSIHLPVVSFLNGMTVDGQGFVWINTPEGVFHQVTDGWTKSRELPNERISTLEFDPHSNMLIAITRNTHTVFLSHDGYKWHAMNDFNLPIRHIALNGSRMFAGTTFDGVVSTDLNANHISAAEAGGGK